MTVTCPPRLRWLALMAVVLVIAFGSSAMAQQDLGTDEIPIDSQQMTTWFTFPVRLGFFIAMLLMAWTFGFLVFFSWLLKRKHAMRPLQAYGLSAGLIWLAWCLSGLLVFQDMLVLKAPSIDNTFVQDWLLTCVIFGVGVVGFFLLRTVFGSRSSTAGS